MQVAGVVESAVVRLPHLDFGEAVVAVVGKEKNSPICVEDIMRQVKQNLANHKVPRNPMSKIQKNVIRAELTQLLDS